jgi:ribose/xylose/arabinose/galactoside ABC-type transport system permease subunit
MSATTVAVREPRRLRARRLLGLLQSVGILTTLTVVCVAVSIADSSFSSAGNIRNILTNASILAVCGFGMTLAIAMRSIDLSVGSVLALTACVAAKVGANDGSVVAAVAAGLGAGLAVGAINGLIISKFRVPAFVATLGMMSVARGVALLYTDGESILVGNASFSWIAREQVLGIPMPFLIALATLALLWLLFNHTRFGRHVAAAGGNEPAAVASGIRIDRLVIAVFALVGLTAGLSGVLTTAQLGNVDPSLGVGFELNVIAVAVLGGTSLAGGNGNLPGTLLAALLIASINSALNILGVQAFYQYLAVGLLLIAALTLEGVRRRVMLSTTPGRAE